MAKIKAKGIDFNSSHLRNNSDVLELNATVASNLHAPNTDTSLDLGGSNPVTAAAIAAFIASKAANSGLASLNSSGKIPDAQLPALAITDTFVVSSQSAMLALTAEVGDVAVRTDENKTYILKTAGASTLANWELLRSPSDAVTSVNGQTGVVVIDAADIAYDNSVTYIDGGIGTDVQAAIYRLDSVMGAAQDDIDELQSDVSALESSMATVQTTVSGHTSDIAGLDSRLSMAEGHITTNENDIALLSARKNIVRQFVTLSSGQISAKQVTLSSTPTSIAVISVTIKGIGMQFPTDDFSLVSGKIDWNTSEGMDSLGLVAGDKLLIEYEI